MTLKGWAVIFSLYFQILHTLLKQKFLFKNLLVTDRFETMFFLFYMTNLTCLSAH